MVTTVASATRSVFLIILFGDFGVARTASAFLGLIPGASLPGGVAGKENL